METTTYITSNSPHLFKLPAELIRSISDHLSLEDKLSVALTCQKLHETISASIWGRLHIDLCDPTSLVKPENRRRRGSDYREQQSNWQQKEHHDRRSLGDRQVNKKHGVTTKPRIVIDLLNLGSVLNSIQTLQVSDASKQRWAMVHTLSIYVELEAENKHEEGGNRSLVLQGLVKLFSILPQFMTSVSRVKFFCGGELGKGTRFCGGMDDPAAVIGLLRNYSNARWSIKLQGLGCHLFRELVTYNVRHLYIRSLYDESPWATLQYMFQSETPVLPPTVEHFGIDGAFGAAWSMNYDAMGKFFAGAHRLQQLHTSPPIADLAMFSEMPMTTQSLSFSYYRTRSSVSTKQVYLPQVTDLTISCDTLDFLPHVQMYNLKTLKLTGPSPSLEPLVPFLADNPGLQSLSLCAATQRTKIPPDLLLHNDQIVHFEANQYFFDTLQPLIWSKQSVKSLVICISTNKDSVAVKCIQYALAIFPRLTSIRVTGHTTDSWIQHTHWAKLMGVSRKPSGGLSVDLEKCHESFNLGDSNAVAAL